MVDSNLEIIRFTSSDKDFQKLYELEKSLDYHVKDWGGVEMLKYHASRIPEKCKPESNFLRLNNKVFGYGYTAHDEWAFDPTLLDSSISFPSEEKYLPYAQELLNYQMSLATKMEEVKTFRAWLYNGNDFYINFYLKNGFKVTQVEFISIISLKEFNPKNFSSYVSRFKEGPFEITNLKELQKSHTNWEEKLYELWHRIERDVPTDVIEPGVDMESWRGHLFTPWFKPEDLYVCLLYTSDAADE